jgi:GNAT superfamily N-acetyltransferase
MKSQSPSPEVRLVPSPKESARFGLLVGRCHLPRGASNDSIVTLVGQVAASEYDVVVVRHSAMDVHVGSLLAHPGLQLISAGTEVTYEGDVGDSDRDPSQFGVPSLVPRVVSAWTSHEDALVEDVFAGYLNHIAANPRLDRALVPAGYAEWASDHVGHDDAMVIVLEAAGDGPVALAALSFSDTSAIVDLAGVVPSRRRQGIYSHLLDVVEAEAQVRGKSNVRIATQVTNIPAQRAWQHRGWRPAGYEHTVHLTRWSRPAPAPRVHRE